jgi:hypothetical protein
MEEEDLSAELAHITCHMKTGNIEMLVAWLNPGLKASEP